MTKTQHEKDLERLENTYIHCQNKLFQVYFSKRTELIDAYQAEREREFIRYLNTPCSHYKPID